MKAISLAAIVLGLVALPLHAQEERITDFASEIEVQISGDLVITETISVIATGDQMKHGIYRDFPTLYRAYGLNRNVAFDLLEVLRDGQAEPWHSAREDNGTRIYIGDANTLIPSGAHTYTLRYHTNRQLVMRPTFDELYWNVTGNQWAFPIDHATAKIRLPTGARVREINAYTGAEGAQGKAWLPLDISGWNVAIETTAPLAAKEGFTVSVTWQKGIVNANANHETLADLAADNQGIVLALCGMAVVLVYYAGAWLWIGRDPPRGVIIPLYQPPQNFSPAAVRYLNGMGKFDNKSFAASVIQLAVSGALRIDRRADKSYSLKRAGGVDGLDLPRRKFYRALMGSRESLDMDNSEHTSFQAARTELQQSLRGEIEKRYFLRNSGWWIAGLLLSLLPAVYALNDSANRGAAVFMALWLAIWSLGVIALLSTAISGWRAGNFLAALPITIFSLPFTAAWFFGAYMLIQSTSPWIAGVFVLGFVISTIFYHLLKAPTRDGRRIMDEIEGFRRYLSIGEQDRLNLENPPDRTPQHYEIFLPYAFALDVEQKWSQQFSGALEGAQYQPDWYHGNGGAFDMSAAGFSSSLGGAFASAISSSSSAPGSSSGSDGGGSSGGGGGGGGGGGW